MIQKKICMLGAFAVGKTSLVSRFVNSMFSETYLTTVGVKIDKKEVRVGGEDVNLVLWDLNGEDEFQSVRMSYLRGASGYLLIVDGTRGDTLDVAIELQKKAEDTVGKVPFLLLLNKEDRSPEWEIGEGDTNRISALGCPVLKTSAKTGEEVEQAFLALAENMMEEQVRSS